MTDFFQQLLQSPATTPATRKAIEIRAAFIETPPQFFSENEFLNLKAFCQRVTLSEVSGVIASQIDNRLFRGHGNGWRYADLPEDGTAIRQFLTALNQAGFLEADETKKDEIIEAARSGELPTLPENWPARRFISDFLSEIAAELVGHPSTLAEMHYAGFADRPGWSKIELNERHNREISKDGEFSLELEPFENIETDWENIDFSKQVEMKRYDNEEEVDALVIGTGAGGGPLMARLAQKGLKVVALEAGKWHDPRAFATDERAQEFLFWLDERISAGKHAVAFGANNSGIGVGGSTIHYTAYVPRALPEDFQIRTDFGVGFDWPIPYSSIEPYYDAVEAFIGVSGPENYPWGPKRKNGFPLAALPVNGAGQLMKKGCDALGITTAPAPNAALSAPYYQEGTGWRAACSNRGFCQAGCSTGGKSSVDVTWIPLAVQNGAEIRPECFVTRIETKDGKVTGVIYTENGVEKRQKCKNLFLCAGAIETPRLLLLNGLCNGSGQVGKNFMAHPGMQVWGVFDEELRPYKGIPGALISQDTHRPKDADFVGGYLLQSIGVMPVTYAAQYARGEMQFGKKLRDHLNKYNHIAGINILGDCLPYEHNFLELSDELDARGIPKPKLHFTAGQNELNMDAHAERIMRDIFSAAGAKEMWSYQRHAHVIGTAMMGTDTAKSVVKPTGQSHEIPNLWISDNSTFPSALDVNPALTIMALSLKTADDFLALHQ